VGVAVLTTAISALHPSHVVAGHTVANIHAYQVGLLISAGIAFLRAIAALSVPDADAAPTMVRRNRSGETAL